MDLGTVLTTLGALLLAGLAVEWAGRILPLPRVTLLLLFGLAIGPSGLALLPSGAAERWFEPLTRVALVMVGFLVGERFSLPRLRRRGAVVFTMAASNVLGAAAAVGLGLLALGTRPELAILLAGIAGASAPAATYDVVAESRAEGPFTDTLLGIVGIDDAWGLLVFSLGIAAVAVTSGDGAAPHALTDAGREIGGALALGVALGVPAGLLTHRIRPGEPTLLEAAGIVLLTAGLATLLEVSFILAAMALGAVMTNIGSHRTRAFHEIEHLEWPFMVVFFVLAGASLHVGALVGVGALGAAYVLLRTAGLSLGASLGAGLAGAEPAVRRWTGIALLPQAGVALGMALVAAQRFPALGDTLLPLIVGSTVVFELVGPVCTRFALARTGEPGRAKEDAADDEAVEGSR